MVYLIYIFRARQDVAGTKGQARGLERYSGEEEDFGRLSSERFRG